MNVSLSRGFGALALLSFYLIASCGKSAQEDDSQTHWLAKCSSSDECAAGLSCVCGRCLQPCEPEAACSTAATGVETSCFQTGSAAVQELCGGDDAPALCLQECSGDGCGEGLACVEGACVPRAGSTDHCSDGVTSGDESDIDCGGSCLACPERAACLRHVDCESAVCRADVCQSATCTDETRNGDETDVDCGGEVCAPCEAGMVCAEASDCNSRACVDEICAGPSCVDAVLNGDETDVDCGGSCEECQDGAQCLEQVDCRERCEDQVCTSCQDEALNGDETDVDCGGAACAGCELEQGCNEDSDCESGFCSHHALFPTPTEFACKPETCGNGEVDGDETDEDCGGQLCEAQCEFGQTCLEDADCWNYVCIDGSCQQPCTDAATDCGTGAECLNEVCVYCTTQDDCDATETCVNNFCLTN